MTIDFVYIDGFVLSLTAQWQNSCGWWYLRLMRKFTLWRVVGVKVQDYVNRRPPHWLRDIGLDTWLPWELVFSFEVLLKNRKCLSVQFLWISKNQSTRNFFDRNNDFFDFSNHAIAFVGFFLKCLRSTVALSSSIRHAFILSCNFSTIYLDLSTVLQANAFLYFILGLCIRQNRKLEKINRNGFWPTNEYLFPGNLFDSSAESFFNFSYHTNAWLVFFFQNSFEPAFLSYCTSFIRQLYLKIYQNIMESISVSKNVTTQAT